MDQNGLSERDSLNASVQLDAIFRAFPDLLFLLDADGQILDYRNGNPSAFKLRSEMILGHSLQTILPAEVGSKFTQTLRQTLQNSTVCSFEFKLQAAEKELWFEARLVPAGDGSHVVTVMRDVSERVRNVQKIQNQVRRLYALHSVDAAITGSFDLQVTLSVILRQMINQLSADAADILILNPHTHMLEFVSGQGFESRQPQPSPLMIGQGYAGKAALERRMINVPDLENQPAHSFPTHGVIQEKFSNYYAVPVIAKGEVKGVLEIYHRSLVQPDDDWLDFLATMANQAAVAIDNATMFQDLQRTTAELSLAYDSVIESWAQILELGNRENGAHAYRVVELTVRLARSMGIAEAELVHFRRGALLHDIGKLGIPENILNKPGPLDQAESKVMKSHPGLAYELLCSVNYLAPALDIPRFHHERWDGSGYPDGLREEQIPFPARLFAVVDVYDALTSDRPYRPACSKQAALNYIEQNSGKLFDPQIVRAFSQMMNEKKSLQG
ncbi:MAG TPA: HD domain-containing phosphohydrolase [Anaerolineales bacterium]|nr:HD domain-containing phosphohydrolase [Anaerolineales bacterium]